MQVPLFLYRLYERRLINELSSAKLPNHVAIMLDGNRRWAREIGQPAAYGHRKGADRMSEFLEWCHESGIKIVTLWLLSTDNLKRDEKELHELVQWAESMVWSSPERHGAMTGLMKTQIDWIPLSVGAVRPTQGKTLAVMQVSGGSQSFNAVNQMRVLGRWMRMLTIPNQSSVAKAYQEFDEVGRMKPSAYYDRIVDVMEELMKFTLLTRDVAPYLVDRYSERKESAEALSRQIGRAHV